MVLLWSLSSRPFDLKSGTITAVPLPCPDFSIFLQSLSLYMGLKSNNIYYTLKTDLKDTEKTNVILFTSNQNFIIATY